ncbi:MAG TPA: DUF4384 domain-containing protein [Bryobacteraceae bacterium]|nr:DUF4384 domain-containing protein [Bryobacteraceae bacterium]
MSQTFGIFLSLLGIAALAPAATAQTAPDKHLNARELFYSAVQEPAAAPKAATTPAARTRTRARKSTPPAAAVEATRTPPKTSTPEPAGEPAALPGGAHVIRASAGPPLGLKYTILKKVGDDMVEVSPDTVFHAGDRIQISVEPNGAGYLYIISQGSSGTWKPMFPSAEVEDGNNRVEGWHNYVLPPKSRIVFDEQTGIEKLFVVFSREPEPDLERMIYSLKGDKTRPAAEPQQTAPQQPKQMLMMASLNIDDATVGRLRNTYARDLVIEKVDENTPGTDQKEKAVYVVNPTGSMDSRVVADLKLVHQ